MAKRAKDQKLPKELEFDFIKSNFFRVIKADGAFGGISPNGSIHMALYSERSAIPTKTFHSLEALGSSVLSCARNVKAEGPFFVKLKWT